VVRFLSPLYHTRRSAFLLPRSIFRASATTIWSRSFCTTQQLKTKVIREVKTILHPNQNQDIVFLGMVKDIVVKMEDKVVQVTVMLEPDKEYRNFKQQIQDKVKLIPGVSKVDVKMAPPPGGTTPPKPNRDAAASAAANRVKGNTRIKHIIAVASCKGGVGKSTVAVNLAYSFAKLGHQVGLLDADIYGPSLPTLIAQAPQQELTYNVDKLINPWVYKNVKCMSYGFTRAPGSPEDTSLVVRGPIVASMVTEIANFTNWGELDYLVVDFPPGTGDIQISLCQHLNIEAAVVITTPSKLAFVDVVKGIQMFDKVKVPTLSVVENLSSFFCSSCGSETFPYGKGHQERIKKQFGIKHAISIPMSEDLALSTDNGEPIVLDQEKDQHVRESFNKLASGLLNELQHAKTILYPTVKPIAETHVVLEYPNGTGLKIRNRFLRSKCKCAHCVNEFTGAQIIKYEQVDITVHPLKIVTTGNYAVTLNWSDGHVSIFPYDTLVSVGREEAGMGT